MRLEENKDFTMRISMLASSSTGNVTYIETPQRKILIDAGLTGKKIEQLMQSIDRNISDIDAIFVTHEHSDHVKGLGVLARRYGVEIYANTKTWEGIGTKCGKIETSLRHVMEPGEILTFGDMDIVSFSVSHDAANAQFYAFQKDNHQFAMMTDIGYVSDRLASYLKNCDAYMIEANHDIDMLRDGRYPWHLKQRILSDRGHLSNEAAGEAMVDMIGNKTKRIYLGHLSEENNTKEVARQTCTQILQEHNLGIDYDFKLYDTDPSEATELFTV